MDCQKLSNEALAAPAKELDWRNEQRISWVSSLKPGAHVHISGVCGTGTSAVLLLLKDLGFRVTGSDKAFYPPMGDVVRKHADRVDEVFSAENLNPRPDLVVIGNALSRGNPEVEYVLEHGIPFASMPEVFSALLIGGKNSCGTSVVVCGTHGKTTTSAALTVVLDFCGRKPGYFIGGMPQELSRGIRLPELSSPAEDRIVVLEGDEYDSAFFAKFPKYHLYRPDIVLLTTLEFDHADIYDSVEEIEAEFTKLLCRLPAHAKVIVSSSEERLRRLTVSWRESEEISAEIFSYGEDKEDFFRLVSRQIDEEHGEQVLTLALSGRTACFSTRLPGRHNALNLLAAAGACFLLGVSPQDMEQAFPRFTGVKRRQELRFEQNGITVIEDFAHHPTEVRETLKALRERYPEKRIIAAFEPRSNTSQRAFFQEEYLQSFACADCSYLVSIAAPGGYAGRASGAAGLDVEKIVRELDAQGKDARAVANTAEMEQLILKVIRPGDLLVLMSNGSFGQLPERIPLRLLQPIAN